MSEVFIRNFNAPANCMECEWRDAEACGECELMIGNPFLSFEEQFAHCPFHVIAKRHPLVPVPAHGRLIDADALGTPCTIEEDTLWRGRVETEVYLASTIENAPTIIPAEEKQL